MSDKRFMVRQWEDIRKGGGVSASIEEIADILQRDDDTMMTRQEVLDRVTGYFNSCLKVVEDEDTGEKVTTWQRNPTKSGLALCLGIASETLIDYVRGRNSKDTPYREDAYSHRKICNDDFDILRKAYQLIELYYEEQLGLNRNNSGSIFWLLNASNKRWSNEQEFKFGRIDGNDRTILRVDDLPTLEMLESAGKRNTDNNDDIYHNVKTDDADDTDDNNDVPFL